MAIDWDQIKQPEFDRIVEALVHRLYDETAEVEVIDGRGGDGGRDIVVRQGSKLRIFQLKCYPEGLSSGWFHRRSKVKASFKSALEHEPDEWVLVVPCKLTDPERRFVMGLSGRASPRLRVWDRPRLDSLLAGHPDLVNYFRRNDYFYDKAKALQVEQAVITEADDLTARLRALSSVVDDVDPDWTFDFSRDGDVIVRTPRPKHPHAAQRSPISFSFNANLDADPALRERWERCVDFGVPGEVTLPGPAIEHFKFSGPAWMAPTGDLQFLTLVTPPDDSRILPLVMKLSGGKLQRPLRFEGEADRLSVGQRGYSFRARFTDLLHLTFRLRRNDAHGDPVHVDVKYGGGTASVADTIESTEVAIALGRCTDIELLLDGRSLARLGAGSAGGLPGLTPESLQDVHDLAADLDVIQRAAGQRFGMPETLNLFERVMIRALRLMLEGQCVYYPTPAHFEITLNGQDDPGLRAAVSGEPHAFRLDADEGPITILGRELQLPRIMRWHPSMIAVDATEILAALDSGRGRGRKVRFEPTNDAPFAMFMPDRWPDPDRRLVPIPWGLRGVDEAAPLAALEGSEGEDDDGGPALQAAG